ncbi:N-acetylmuramoyl-L-alanine amidase [Cochlodiniinecator piscidefendens]|uniref:N-acetylmuramoyl-L-alanine amidase n=1 Tax=Cochlodiniinecator piscidefendens TaxID=2715756 RepID=UPI00140BC71A|nr:N-acetylmuramoyl-L-alanine amidase [Cochlodiniinecator piscidefendens]
MVVLHYTAMNSCEEARVRLSDPAIEVSAHYLISEQGDVLQLVSEENRAWHAGAGSWGNVRDVNSHSVGIELANTGSTPFSAPQMDALEALLADVLKRWSIPPERVIGHSDMAPDRKLDPGSRFDWRRLARQGLSVWPDNDLTCPVDEVLFEGNLSAIGYPLVGGRLTAFRLRFRPQAFGPLDGVDMALAAYLALCFPVDPSIRNA